MILIKKENAIKAYNEADDSTKKVLINLLGEEHFIEKDPFDVILEGQGINKQDFEVQCMNLTSDEIAYRKLKLITKHYNNDWEPNWQDSNEKKWYPWFCMDNFRLNHCDCLNSYSVVPARLCFRKKEDALEASEKFFDVFKTFYTCT